MTKRKKRNRVVFEMDGKRYTTSTSSVPRFDWSQLRKALMSLKELVNEETKYTIDYVLSSGRDITHLILWDLFCVLEEQITTKVPRLVFLWVVACYGYIHGLSTNKEEYKTWPHPTYPFKKSKKKFYDFRDELKCPVCFKPYTSPKRYVNKKAILRHFRTWIGKHLETEACLY